MEQESFETIFKQKMKELEDAYYRKIERERKIRERESLERGTPPLPFEKEDTRVYDSRNPKDLEEVAKKFDEIKQIISGGLNYPSDVRRTIAQHIKKPKTDV